MINNILWYHLEISNPKWDKTSYEMKFTYSIKISDKVSVNKISIQNVWIESSIDLNNFFCCLSYVTRSPVQITDTANQTAQLDWIENILEKEKKTTTEQHSIVNMDFWWVLNRMADKRSRYFNKKSIQFSWAY